MATSDDALETFHQLPLRIDPASKQISCTTSDQSIHDAIASLNALHTACKSLETPTPPPPMAVNPKRSAQIAKLRDSASTATRKQQFPDAIRLWTVAIDMAASRPSWEPQGLIREELAALYLGRSNSHTGAQNWVDGWKDAETSKEIKRGIQTGPNGEKVPGNPKAYLLGGKCLLEMGKWSEAVEWYEQGLEVEGNEGEDGKAMTMMLGQARQQLEKSESKA